MSGGGPRICVNEVQYDWKEAFCAEEGELMKSRDVWKRTTEEDRNIMPQYLSP